MASTTTTLVAIVVVACLLASGPQEADAAITCGQVVGYISSCLPYARRGGAIPPRCCSGVRALNGAARTTPDRQQVCSCLKSIAGSSGVPYAPGIPSKCGVSVPYVISPSTDCTK
ncbi:Non-specific lipid-transfer protein 4 [Acorus gramineus]|uniref:Non-specific lipid-transfer protein n=1 Tax=Acorus gramineus TaxID=55184 RepID=A0AAV9ALW7_ACOGR|nr:Non-specific lipid-transfer protein 4 [Acorus gramineus]